MSAASRFLSAQDVALELGYSVRKAYLVMHEMVHVVDGRSIRVSRQALETWVRNHSCPPGSTSHASTRAARNESSGAPSGATDGPRAQPILVKLSGKSENATIHVTQPRRRRSA